MKPNNQPVENPTVRFDGKREVVLMAPWSVVTPHGTLHAEVGARSDGASIPRLLWGIPGFAGFSGDTLPAAFAHDQLYAGELTARWKADDIFRQILVRCGVSRPRAFIMYRAVRDFGGIMWSRHTPESVEIARKFARFVRA